MDVVKQIESTLLEFGYECSPFLVDWYNAIVDKRFQLSFKPNTVAVSVVSAPDMFQKAFLPFVEASRDKLSNTCQDSLDQCTRHYFQNVKDKLLESGTECEAIFDFDTLPSGQPRCLVQAAGHVSGQARYYQRVDVLEGDGISWPQDKRIYGACAHPKYGGWFAFRGIFVLPGVEAADLPPPQPVDCLPTAAERFRYLDLFNHHWRDGRFRDVPPSIAARYSEQQVAYFNTAPRERHRLLGLPAPRSVYDLSDSEEENDDAVSAAAVSAASAGPTHAVGGAHG